MVARACFRSSLTRTSLEPPFSFRPILVNTLLNLLSSSRLVPLALKTSPRSVGSLSTAKKRTHNNQQQQHTTQLRSPLPGPIRLRLARDLGGELALLLVGACLTTASRDVLCPDILAPTSTGTRGGSGARARTGDRFLLLLGIPPRLLLPALLLLALGLLLLVIVALLLLLFALAVRLARFLLLLFLLRLFLAVLALLLLGLLGGTRFTVRLCLRALLLRVVHLAEIRRLVVLTQGVTSDSDHHPCRLPLLLLLLLLLLVYCSVVSSPVDSGWLLSECCCW
jgi:hypothetical protein